MTAREPLEPSAESAVYRKALTWGAIALGVLAVVAAVVGWLVDGAMGAWAAPAGVALAALAGLLTPWAMQLAHTRRSDIMAAILLGTWLGKMIVVVVGLVLLSMVPNFPRPLFGIFVVLGVLVTLAVDVAVLSRGRVPYTTKRSNHRDE